MKHHSLKRHALATTAVTALVLGVGVAYAQSGHFVGTPTCTDIGTQLQCTGKVAGLGGTTFTITVVGQGTASVECANPAGNVAPGQSFTFTAAGSFTGETPRNGQFTFSNPPLTTATPTAPPGSCPNRKWTPTVTDVAFTTATLTLLEDNTTSDQITVPVQ